MDPQRSSPTNNGAVLSGFINLLVIVIALVVIYYSYQYFSGSTVLTSSVIQSTQITANQGTKNYTNQARMYEGGEYSVNFWLYITGWTYKQNLNKHVLEIGGPTFSTLLVSLGAATNSLAVTIDTLDASGSSTSLLFKDAENTFFSANAGALSDASVTGCGIDKVDLQRWVQVSIVLNGNVSDVYMDGKLVQSCVLPSYFKVDTSGTQTVKLVDRGGFDGYVTQVSTFNYALNPSTIYNMYMAGPSPPGLNMWAYVSSFFTKQSN